MKLVVEIRNVKFQFLYYHFYSLMVLDMLRTLKLDMIMAGPTTFTIQDSMFWTCKMNES